MTSILPLGAPAPKRFQWREFAVSLGLYLLFAVSVFFVMGPHPLLGSDHVTYIRLAVEIAEKRPNGDYWGEFNSVRSFSAMLAWLHHFTGSYVTSMKLILAAVSVPYLLAIELLFSLFTLHRWIRRLFALLSAFAVSFGVASWGITDYTALMPRTLVMPVIFFCVWLFLRFFHQGWRYAVFPVLVLFSIIHLSTFYLIGVLVVFEGFDFFLIRRREVDARLVAFPVWLLVAFILLVGLQRTGVSVGATSYLASMFFPNSVTRGTNFAVAESTRRTGDLSSIAIAPTQTLEAESFSPQGNARTAWTAELNLRAWRNMPLPLVNVANILSSFALILLLAVAGGWLAFRESPRELDLIMTWWVPANLLFALGPQTALWILRQFTGIFPVNIEEIRSLSFLMIPALYFSLRLFEWLSEQPRRTALGGQTAVVALYLLLPLVMKSLTVGVREKLLSLMTRTGAVDSNSVAINNARSALGLNYTVPLYYPAQQISEWLEAHGRVGSLVLTDRDDLFARNFLFAGSRQEVALQDFVQNNHAQAVLQVYNRLKKALADRDLNAVLALARQIHAGYAVVPWTVEGAVYHDANFSLIDIQHFENAAPHP